MIKGLYFKLNIDKNHDKEIHDFFEDARNRGINKIDLLYYMCRIFQTTKETVSGLGADAIKEKMEEIKND